MWQQDNWHEIRTSLQDVGATWGLVAVLLVMIAVFEAA